MTTTILPSTGLSGLLKDKILFVDTNVFIGASLSNELALFLTEQRHSNNCQILTVSSTVYEYTRGSNRLQDFNNKREFVASLVNSIVSVGRILENPQNDVFSLVMSTLLSKGDSDYTDYLLATCLYQYSRVEEVFLMTTDKRSMPYNVFDIVGTLTTNVKQPHNKVELLHYGFYSFNRDNFLKISKSLSK